MSIDWNAEVNLVELLTSTNEMDRAKGAIYWTLRNDPANRYTGDELFLAKAHAMLTKEVSNILSNQFVGVAVNERVLDEVRQATKHIMRQFVADMPSITVTLDKTNPANIHVGVGYPMHLHTDLEAERTEDDE